MTRQTSTEKARTLREKRAREGLAEVRGVWAPKAEHAQAKRYMHTGPLLLDACKRIVAAFDALAPSSAARNAPMEINAARAAIKATEPAQRMRKEWKK